MTRIRLVLAALACAALVAHLLFIPYAYSPLTFGEALQRFARIQWHQLGSDQNVALVSRALMFAPLGLLIAACLTPHPRRRFEGLALVVACLLGCAWALAVNFGQVWFPARTVNLNNVAAEFCGVIAGGLLWSTLGASGLRWWRQLASGGRFGLSAALNGYVVLYLVASLLPFDFVTSAGDLAEKGASNLYGLWIAPVGCGPAPCGLKFLSMLLATVPCGWWFVARRRGVSNVWLPATVLAVIVASIIEVLHFFMVSGVSQGASVLMRTLGMTLGAVTFSWRHRLAAFDLNRLGRFAVIVFIAPYLVAIAYVGGWFRAAKLGVAAGLARMDEVVWLPFFHQYYAPYNATMSSALVHIALYAPIGAMCWMWARRRDRAPLWLAALLAIALAFVAETSKVFLAGRVPDYTDVFIAAVSATLTLAVLRFFSRSQQAPQDLGTVLSATVPLPQRAPDLQPAAMDAATAGNFARAVGAMLIAVALWTAVDFPIGTWALLVGLTAYAALLFRFPSAYLIAVPVLLPVLDLAPFSGRFFWDEFDALLATTLGVRLLMKLPVIQKQPAMPRTALGWVAVSVILSTAMGLWPPSPLDANAFSSYLSGYNGLRIAKGYVWAGALLWLIRRDASAHRDVAARLQLGLALALLAAVISILVERLSFVGSADVATWFRVGGFVSATHTGGAYLEGMLVALAPFALLLAVTATGTLRPVGWYCLVILGACAVLVTLSRTAAAAWVLGVVVFAVVWWLKSRKERMRGAMAPWRWGAGIALCGVILVAIAIAQSTPLRDRFAESSADLPTRTAHWMETIGLMRFDPLHALLGAGIGSFPREYYLAYAVPKQMPGYRLEREADGDKMYLALLGGRGMYMDQRIAASPGARLRFKGQIRASKASASLSAGLCEKSFLNSVACEWAEIPAGQHWQSFDVTLAVPTRPGAALPWHAPSALSLHNGVFGTWIDLRQLSLSDAHGDVLRNGSFKHNLDRWFVTSDDHLAWRVKNTPLQIAFEQGLIGVLAMLMLAIAAVSIVNDPRVEASAAAVFASALASFALVGCFDTLLDSPRLVMVLALILSAGFIGHLASLRSAGATHST